MQETLGGIGELFVSAFIASTIAPDGFEAVLAYLVAQGHYQVEFVVIVASIGNMLGAMTTWGFGMLAAKKFPAAVLLPEKKQKALNILKKNGIWSAACFHGYQS